MAQFIGAKEVLGVTTEDFKTPNGGEVVKVVYKSGQTSVMPRRTFDLFVSSNPNQDENALFAKKRDALVPLIIQLLLEYDVRLTEMSLLLRAVGDSLVESVNRATSYLWTGTDSAYIPGVDSMDQRTILEAHRQILQIAEKSKKDGQSAPAKQS